MSMDPAIKKWNYEIELTSDLEWWRYFGEYCKIVDIIFERARQSEVTVIARPYLFLVRHTLELGYKANIVELQKLSELDYQLKEGHDLSVLHDDLDRHFQAVADLYDFGPEILEEYNALESKLNDLKSELHSLDQGSSAFRYPFKTDLETPVLENGEVINLLETRELYDDAKKFLKYMTDVVENEIWIKG